MPQWVTAIASSWFQAYFIELINKYEWRNICALFSESTWSYPQGIIEDVNEWVSLIYNDDNYQHAWNSKSDCPALGADYAVHLN